MVKKLETTEKFLRYQTNTSIEFEKPHGMDETRIVFDLTRQLVNAQFHLADEELTQRLWQDVEDKNIDKDRIINLMYKCSIYEEPEMIEIDDKYQARIDQMQD